MGTIIGAVSILFIYPLNDELYGFAQWLAGTAILLLPVATLGVHALIIKFFPNFKQRNKTPNFNSILGLLFVTLYSIFIIVFVLLQDQLIIFFEFLKMKSSLIFEYKWIILTLLGLFILELWFRLQSANNKRIVVPSLISQIGYKFYLPLLILMSLYVTIDLQLGGWLVIGFYVIAVIFLFIYLRSIKAISFGKPIWSPEVGVNKKEAATFSLFGSMNSLGGKLSFRVDSVMIPLLLDFFSNGVYNKILFMSNVVAIPSNSIGQIASPIISEAFKNEDYNKIDDIYKRSSSNLFLIGSFIFLILWFNILDIISFSSNPDSFPSILTILLFLGSAKLIDMITSVNTYILIYSRYYKFNLLFLLSLGVMNIILNYWWLQMYGLVGAAMATFTAIIIFNLLKFLFIWYKLKMQPFTIETIKVLFLFGCSFLILMILPTFESPIINIFIKSFITVLLYFCCIYSFSVTKDSTMILNQFIQKIKSKI